MTITPADLRSLRKYMEDVAGPDVWLWPIPSSQYHKLLAACVRPRRFVWRKAIGRRWLAHRAYKGLPKRGLYARAARRFGPPPPPEEASCYDQLSWYLRANYFEVTPKLYEQKSSIVRMLEQSRRRR